MDRGAKLTKDARYFGATMFALMEPGKGQLVFKMIESKPSPRSQAALDELVAAGMVSVGPFNKYGGVIYRPLVEFERRVKAPPGDWPITVPIDIALNQNGRAHHG